MTPEEIEQLRKEFEEASDEALGLWEDYQDAKWRADDAGAEAALKAQQAQEAVAKELGLKLQQYDPTIFAWWKKVEEPTGQKFPTYEILTPAS